MRYQYSVLSRTTLAIILLEVVALIVGDRPGASARQSLLAARHRPPSGTCAVCYTFEPIDAQPGAYNQVTGIDDFENIVGAYSASGSGPYTSFAVEAIATPKDKPPTYGTPVSESDGSNNWSIFLQSLDTGHQNLTNDRFVGYWQPSYCPEQCGVFHVQDSAWNTVTDKKQGKGPCAVTELLGINDSHVGVGFYEKGMTNPCGTQAFEYYPDPIIQNAYDFVDIGPSSAPNNTAVESTTATGINNLGDIVGTETWYNGTAKWTTGWYYSDLAYYPICYTSCTSPTYNTFVEGVNFSDGVVGYYSVGSSVSHGFIITNAVEVSPLTFNPVDDMNNYTVVRSISTHWYIAGWTKGDGGKYHGFVGVCTLGCKGSGTAAGGGHVTSSPKSPRRNNSFPAR